MKRYLVGAMLAAAVLLAYGLAGSADKAEAERQRDRYCDMAALWAETNGKAGWPPYDGECED